MITMMVMMAEVARASVNQPTGLLTNQLGSPAVGITAGGPLSFSWVVPHLEACGRPAQLQTAWQLRLQQISANDGGGADSSSSTAIDTRWESPRVVSNASVNVPYTGPPLLPGKYYKWSVTVWTNSLLGRKQASASPLSSCKSAPSEQATFITALTQLGASDGSSAPRSAPIWAPGSNTTFALFRKTFPVRSIASSGSVVSAVAFVTATSGDFSGSAGGDLEAFRLLGAYKLYLNGNIVGIGPGRGEVKVSNATSPRNHPYDTIDVTDALAAAISVGHEITLGIQSYHGSGGDEALVHLELHLAHINGTTVLGTDQSWASYDARRVFVAGIPDTCGRPNEDIDADEVAAVEGWKLPTFIASDKWRPAAGRTWPARVQAKRTHALQVTENIAPQSVVQTSPGRWLIDMGSELMAGVQLRISALQRAQMGDATHVQVTLSEQLLESAEGFLTPRFPCSSSNYFRSNFKLRADNTTASAFEHHEYMSFRWAELLICEPGSVGSKTDSCKPLRQLHSEMWSERGGAREHRHRSAPFTLTMWSVHYQWSETDSSFTSSNPMLNDVYSLVENTHRVTALDTFTGEQRTGEFLGLVPLRVVRVLTPTACLSIQIATPGSEHHTRRMALSTRDHDGSFSASGTGFGIRPHTLPTIRPGQRSGSSTW